MGKRAGCQASVKKGGTKRQSKSHEFPLPKDSPIADAFVEPFVIATKPLSSKSPLLGISPCLPPLVNESSRWDYFLKGGIFHFVSDKTGDHPRVKRSHPYWFNARAIKVWCVNSKTYVASAQIPANYAIQYRVPLHYPLQTRVSIWIFFANQMTY